MRAIIVSCTLAEDKDSPYYAGKGGRQGAWLLYQHSVYYYVCVHILYMYMEIGEALLEYVANKHCGTNSASMGLLH